MSNAYKISVEKLKRKKHLENPGVDGMIILQWILRKQGGRVWSGCNWLIRTLVNTVMNPRFQ
jgi:hypothetical protein